MSDQMTAQKAKFIAEKLKFAASKLFEQKPDGSYSMKTGEPEPSQGFFEAINGYKPEKIGKFLHKLGNPEKAQDSAQLKKVAAYLEKIGMKNFQTFAAGSNAVVLKGQGNTVVRLSATEKERPRVELDEVLQPIHSADREGADVGGLKVEVLPRVPMLKDAMKAAGSEIDQQDVYKLFLHSLPKDKVDTDLNNYGNLGILPDGTVLNIDPDAVLEKKDLKPKKVAKLEAIIKDTYKLPEGTPKVFAWRDNKGASKQAAQLNIPPYGADKAKTNSKIMLNKLLTDKLGKTK